MINDYLNILHFEIPDWLNPYLEVPCLKRLKHIGLFCGVDYSCLFHPHVFYSRFDHSLGVALIIWHFTHHKEATLAGLLHDVSSPIFSHAIDFKNKDYLNQESTEKDNAQMILEDQTLVQLLQVDSINIDDILHYDHYPVADLKTPAICADRLEYMFSTGYFLCDSFDLKLIKKCYENISIQESGELGFNDEGIATEFFEACLKVTQLFLEPYDKITLQILASLVEEALNKKIILPQDIYLKTEQEVITLFKESKLPTIQKLYHLLTKQTTIITQPTPMDNAFCMKIDVKRRYIDPLVENKRLSDINPLIKEKINALFYIDDNYICVPYIKKTL